MIVDRVLDYLNGEGREVEDETVQTAISLVARTIKRNFGVRGISKPRKQSPSSTWACQRRRVFDADPNTKPEPLSARARNIFALGDTVEALGIAAARTAGVEFESPTVDGEQLEIRAEHGGREIVGHLDGNLRDIDVGIIPLDYKSMSDISFDNAERAANDPSADWWQREKWGIIAQMQWYLWILHWMVERGLIEGPVADYGLIIAVRKSTGHMAELRVYRDKEQMEMLLASFAFVGDLIDAMENDGVTVEDIMGSLDRPGWTEIVESPGKRLLPDGSKGKCLEINTSGDKWRCGYCPYTEACYPGFQVVAQAKPVWRKPI